MPRKLDQLIILFAALIMVCSNTVAAKPNGITHIQFYMHDITGGSNPTAVLVAGRISNYTGSDPITASFGSVYVIANPLTTTPDPNSTVFGRAQGTYVMSSQYNEFSLHMTITYVFNADGL